MAKFRSPFGTNELWLTQTYHTGSNNTAIDLSATAGTPVYALADGKITYRSSGAGSYCIQDVDNSDLKIYYVHTYKWIAANSIVKKGQKICEVAPTSVNGGYPTHLHLGLQAGKYIIDYIDRSIAFKTKYQAIKDVWFKGETFDWSKHKDLSYENTTMKYKVGDTIQFIGEQNIRQGSGTSFPVISVAHIGDVATIIDGPRTADSYTWYDLRFSRGGTGWCADVNKWEIYVKPEEPPVDPGQTEGEKEVDRLKNDIRELESTTELLESELSTLVDENSELMESLEKEKEMFNEMQGWYTECSWKLSKAQVDNMELIKELGECKEKLEEGKTNFIKQITDKLGEWLSKILGDRT